MGRIIEAPESANKDLKTCKRQQHGKYEGLGREILQAGLKNRRTGLETVLLKNR
jgi:hypothetical protein